MFLKLAQESGSKLSERILEGIRVHCPKEFFKAIHTMMKTKSKAFIAQHFKTQIINGTISQSESVRDYVSKLYK